MKPFEATAGPVVLPGVGSEDDVVSPGGGR
jgi:hypothetical protein